MKKITEITKAEWIHLAFGLTILILAYVAGYISTNHYVIGWFLMGIAGAIVGLTS